MRTVYKYELVIPDGPPGTLGEVSLPACAKILKIAAQGRSYFIWCLISLPVEITRTYKFLVAGTGHEFSPSALEGLTYIDTIITHEGSLVFHFWMEK